MVVESKLEDTMKVIKKVADDWPRREFLCFFSGGKDSLVSTHLLHEVIPEKCEVVFIDTTIGAYETQDYVKKVCDKFGWKLNIIRPKRTYEELVAKWGFPHFVNYRWCMHHLQLNTIKEFVKGKRAIQVTGVRKDESVRRLIAYRCVKEFSKDQLGNFMLAPLLRWTKHDVRGYIKKYELPSNPLAQIFHFSCDCFCMAYPSAPKLKKIRAHLPYIFAKLKNLEQELTNSGYTIVRGLSTKEIEEQELMSAYICPCVPEGS